MNKHSFAVLAYKDSPYISLCIESLQAQTVASEIYITTSTPSAYITEIADKYGIKIFTTSSGLGIGHDWNFSYNLAKTKYVTLAHQDDIYLPEYTDRVVTALEKYNDSLICFTDYYEMANEQERKNTTLLLTKRLLIRFFMFFRRNIRNRFWKRASQSFGNLIPCPSVTYNKELLNDFKFSQNFSINLDWDAWIKMARMNGRFVYISKYLLIHRIHKGSATTEGIKNRTRQNEDFEIYKRVWPAFIAKLLTKLYAASYSSNSLKDTKKNNKNTYEIN